MKKWLLGGFTLMLTFFLTLTANAKIELEVLNRFGTTNPATHYGGNDPVMIPTQMQFKTQQFRGAWVATVSQIDMPVHTSEEQYKAEYLNVLNTLEAYNMNAVIFQVRPMNDAFYQSDLNPYSQYLTGKQGRDPGWDVLGWMVDETHKRGMEFHAWLNPYRVTNSAVSNKETYLNTLDPKNYARQNPDQVLVGGEKKLVLNPGHPEVRQFIFDTIEEIVVNYDVDAIHFDDYFYPYDGIPVTEDKASYEAFNPNNLSLEDWRRENVDHLIKGIKDVLTEHNQTNQKAVQLGISPFGIWANKKDHELGSNTNGGDTYFSHYADTRKWVKEGWVDYINPQDYWEIEGPLASYVDVLDWWADLVEGTDVNLYIGHALYRHEQETSNNIWVNHGREVYNQLLYNGKYDQVDGDVYFSFKHLDQKRFNNKTALVSDRNLIKNEAYQYKVLPRALKNVDAVAPNKPTNVTLNSITNGYKLNWDKDQDAKAYYVYRYLEEEQVFLDDPSKIVAVINAYNNDLMEFIDTTIETGKTYKYYVTAFDRANNQSAPTGLDTNGHTVETEDLRIVEIQHQLNSIDLNIASINKLATTLSSNTVSALDLVPEIQLILEEGSTTLSEINQLIEELNTEVNALKEAKLDLEAQISSLQELVLNYLSNQEKLEQSVIDNLKSTLTSLKTKNQEIINRINAIETGLATLDEGKSTLTKTINKATSKLSVLRFSLVEIGKYQADFIRLIDKIEWKANELEDNQSVISDLQAMVSEMNTYLARHTELQTIKTNNGNVITDLDTDYDDMLSNNDNLYKQNTALNSKIRNISKELPGLKENLEHESKYNELETKINTLQPIVTEPEDPIPNEPNEPEPNDSQKDNDGNNAGLIVAIVAGSAMVLGAGVFAFSKFKK
jgi:uncharacterized lipoprotein YddW (UPF0748 family)/predicted  nucleic acid-binding Zn-ribbon protein